MKRSWQTAPFAESESMEMAERNQQSGHLWVESPLPHPKEVIQLTELAVRNKLPPGTTEDDMYLALDKCGMTVEEIFDELDRIAPKTFGSSSKEVNTQAMAFCIEAMLYERFGRRLREVTAHKVPP